jgi:hypothetical protein
VTRVIRRTLAVAAKRASIAGTDRMALNRPQAPATSLSMGGCDRQRNPAKQRATDPERERVRAPSPLPIDASADFAQHQDAEIDFHILDRGMPRSDLPMAAIALANLRNDVGVNQIAHSPTSRPRSMPSSSALNPVPLPRNNLATRASAQPRAGARRAHRPNVFAMISSQRLPSDGSATLRSPPKAAFRRFEGWPPMPQRHGRIGKAVQYAASCGS